MPQKRRYTPPKRPGGRSTPETRTLHRPPALVERQAPTVYGKPFILMEDGEKNTFIYKAGAWSQGLTLIHCNGLTGTPWTSSAQWRCGAVDLPVEPT